MSIYIGNNLEDRLKALEAENASVRKYIEYHQVVNEIDHMSDLHEDSSFYKRSMKLDNYVKINEWFDSSIGQSSVIQQLNVKRPALSNPDQMQNKRRYVNFNLNNNVETTVFIVFKITGIVSGDQEIINNLIGYSVIDNGKLKINAKHISFYKTHSGNLGLLIPKAQSGSYVAIANDISNLFPEPDLEFPSSKSNCIALNKWYIISVTWSNKKSLSNCWSNGIKIITLTSGDAKGSDYSFIGDLGRLNDSYNTYLSGCIGEIIGFHRSLIDTETSYIHQYLMRKWGI